MALALSADGAALVPGVARALLPALEDLASRIPAGRAGVRLHGLPGLAPLVAPGEALARVAERALGTDARAVRAILFDKSPDANWSLGWHQDRTICVAARHDEPGYGPWSVKQGLLHVEPPFAVIEGMLTMRIHLDPVDADNAPLLVAPGSHRVGRIAEADVAETVRRCGTATCLADAGDVWLYATPILHASGASIGGRHRRVLQLDFASMSLPSGLEWLGIDAAGAA